MRECVLFRVVLIFFFFQAEDGIRDLTVTGVQTCALPISFRNSSTGRSSSGWNRSATNNIGGAENASRDREAVAREIRTAEEATRRGNHARRHEGLELRRRVRLGRIRRSLGRGLG